MRPRLLLAVAIAIAFLILVGRHDGGDNSPAQPPPTDSTPSASAPFPGAAESGPQAPGGLPPEAVSTITLIQDNGPFPYRQDGGVFMNRERRLPGHERGYWREYTVPTPGSPDRGARRIVHGDGDEFYYTDDHYASFVLVRVPDRVSP